MKHAVWMIALVVSVGLVGAGCAKDEPKKEEPKAEKKTEPAKAGPAEAVKEPAAAKEAEKPVAAEAEKPVVAPEKPVEVAATPEALLDAAIAAAGGLDNLKAKLGSYNYKSTGSYFGTPYVMETTWKAPDKMLMGLENGATVMGYVGTVCWTKMGNVVLDCPEDEKASAAEMLLVAQWTSLYPLKEGGVKLELAEPVTRNEKKLEALKVSKEDGSFSAVLFFDEATKLPAGCRYVGHFMGQKGTLETWITELKDFEGVKLPSKTVMTFEGKTLIEDNVETMQFGKVDDAAFAKPETLVGVPKVRTLPERLVASSIHKGPYPTMGMTIGMLYGWMGQAGITPMGVPVQVYLVDPTTEKDPSKYETEIWIQVAKPDKEPAADPARTLKTLPALEIAVQAEVGPFEKTGEAFGKLKTWLESNGYEIAGPAGMISYSNPMDTPPERLVNEVFFPVKKKGQ